MTMNTIVSIKKSIYFTWKCIITAIFTKNDDIIKILKLKNAQTNHNLAKLLTYLDSVCHSAFTDMSLTYVMLEKIFPKFLLTS